MSELEARIIKENKKDCAEGKIKNPATKRCVEIKGPTGLKVIDALKREWEKKEKKGGADTSSSSSSVEVAPKPKKPKVKSSSKEKPEKPKKSKPKPIAPAPSSAEEIDDIFKEAIDSQPEDDGPNPFDDDYVPPSPKKAKKSALAIKPAPEKLGDCAKAGQLRNIAIDERGGSNRCSNFENVWDKIKAVIDDNLDVSINQLEKMFGGKFTDENKKAIKKYVMSKGDSGEAEPSEAPKPKKSKKEVPKPVSQPVEKVKPVEKPIEKEPVPSVSEPELDYLTELVYAQYLPHKWIKAKRFKKFLRKNIKIQADHQRTLTRLQSAVTFIDLSMLSAPCAIESYKLEEYKYFGAGKIDGKWVLVSEEDGDRMYSEQAERGEREYVAEEIEREDRAKVPHREEQDCDLNSECAEGRICNLDSKKCVDSAGSDMEVTTINGNKVVGSKESISKLKALMSGSADYVIAQKTVGAIGRSEMIAFLRSKKPDVDYKSRSDAELSELLEVLVQPKVEGDMLSFLPQFDLSGGIAVPPPPSAVLVNIENGKEKDGLAVVFEEETFTSSSSSSSSTKSPVRPSPVRAGPRPVIKPVISPIVEVPKRAPTPPSPVLSSRSVTPPRVPKPASTVKPISPARSMSISPARSEASNSSSAKSAKSIKPVQKDELSDTDSTTSLPEPGVSKNDLDAIRACLLGKR